MHLAVYFLLAIVAAVILWFVFGRRRSRARADNSGHRRTDSRTVPFPEKHPPVDVTPSTTSPDLLDHRVDATGTPSGADIDGMMRRLAAIKAKQEQRSAPVRDDIKRITGIGPKLEQMLNANGIFHFRQIADWHDADIQAIDKLLSAFHGRIQREDWVGQARRLRDGE